MPNPKAEVRGAAAGDRGCGLLSGLLIFFPEARAGGRFGYGFFATLVQYLACEVWEGAMSGDRVEIGVACGVPGHVILEAKRRRGKEEDENEIENEIENVIENENVQEFLICQSSSGATRRGIGPVVLDDGRLTGREARS